MTLLFSFTHANAIDANALQLRYITVYIGCSSFLFIEGYRDSFNVPVSVYHDIQT